MRIFFLILFLLTINLYGGNPFLTKPKTDKKKVKTEQNIEKTENKPIIATPSIWIKGKKILFKWQYEIRKKISSISKKIKNSPNPSIFFISFFLAFLYGLLHALGPGHGKVFAISYFLSKKSEFKKGFLLGFGIAFFHAISAVIVVLMIYFILKLSLATSANKAEIVIQPISYGLITLLGIYLLFSHIREIIKSKKGGSNNSEESYNPKDNRSILMMSIAVGMVPCPATTFILLFSIAIDILWFGLFLAFAVSLGMGVTISLVGVITIFFKNRGKIIKNDDKPSKIHNFIELFGAVMIILIGGFLLLSTLV